MKVLSSSLVFISVLSVLGIGKQSYAQTIDQSLSGEKSEQSTSEQEAISANPIKITITQEAPSSDLPDVTGNYSLSRAIKVGLEHNLDISASNSATKIAAFNTRSALGRFGPMITFNPFYSTSSLNQMAFYPNDGAGLLSTAMQPIVRGTSFSVIFYGMQPLYTGGLLKGNYRAAKAIEKQSIALYQSNKIETVRKIRETYWKTAWNEARLRVDTDYVRFRAWSTSNMKERMIEGKVPRADYLREEAELNKARIQLNQDYRDYNTALIDLKVAMGVNLASVIDLTDHLDFVDVSGNLSVYLKKKSASNRPEIIEAESKINEMKAKKMMARSQYLPHLDLYGIGSNITGSSPDGNARGRWGGVIGVAGHYTIFDSGQRKGQLQAATEAIYQAVFANQQVKLKVAQDVSTAWIDLDLARRNVELAKAQVVSAQEDQRLFHQRYIIGKAIALEDFDATVKLFQARLALLEEIYKYRLAEARLYWASGSIY